MAYNIESLVKVLELILNCSDQGELISDHKVIIIPQIKSLLEKSCFLRDSLATTLISQEDRISANFEDQIRDAAQNAEDVLETYNVALRYSDDKGIMIIPPPDLRKLFEDFDSLKEEMMMMMKLLDGGPTLMDGASSSRISTDPNPKKILVGFAGDLIQLKERVLGDSTKLEIIPIVGMGGIGKTTLACKIYDDSSVVSHFDARAWTTVSYDYSLLDILQGLLSCITKKHREELMQEKDSDRLAVTLHKNLMGRRYLIVLDDIWRLKAWDDVKMFFPDQNNGSRIILTTRESNVATYADSKSPHHQVRPLSEVDGWKLLTKKVFGDQVTTCPLELEELGKKIANNCGGLPLAIHVIGGLLPHVKRTKDSWKQVADDVSSAIANHKDGEEFSSRILSLSYDHLPYYLKPCFLYLSVFPEDYEIRASMLIRLWVAEGFLKPTEDKSQEEVAKMYLEALIDRNLIFAGERHKTNGKLKYCAMHDLLRDLCVTKARQNKFFNIMNNIPQDNTLCQRRVSVHTSRRNIDDIYSSIGPMPFARSLIFIGPASSTRKTVFFSPVLSHNVVCPGLSTLRLLRVLDVLEIVFLEFPRDILKLVNLRYLAFTCSFDHELDPRITEFRHLQTLIVRILGRINRCKVTPEIIFNMPSLREIKFVVDTYSVVWCDLQESEEYGLQVNLHSLSILEIPNFGLIVEKIPNLKKLGIHYSNKSDSLVTDLTCLRKLETLECTNDYSAESKTYLSKLIFPVSLKKLSLTFSLVTEVCMKRIGMLPNLEILKLYLVAFESDTWEPSEGEFSRLQLLQLERVNVVDWSADETNFPRLQHLIIKGCRFLREIPSGIGEISTLKTIEVSDSNPSVVASARKIHEEQLELGNDILLQVDIL